MNSFLSREAKFSDISREFSCSNMFKVTLVPTEFSHERPTQWRWNKYIPFPNSYYLLGGPLAFSSGCDRLPVITYRQNGGLLESIANLALLWLSCNNLWLLKTHNNCMPSCNQYEKKSIFILQKSAIRVYTTKSSNRMTSYLQWLGNHL